ncbi:MAG: hypothetical protein LBK54_09785 [Propionibacteriaceae bacterium]|jgi:ABC-type transport system substrate-binding protein|nr:hypothetical protein [Propionibacteriaceae bacterium]
MQTTTHGRSPSGRLKTIALTAALALGAGLTGCASDSSDQPSGAADAYDPISVSASPPDGPLIPTDSEEQGRKTLVFVLFEGLVRVDETSGQVVNAVADTTDQAVAYFNQAQEVLFRDLPAIPLWYSYSSIIHSTRVTGVIIGPAGAFTSHLYERVAP